MKKSVKLLSVAAALLMLTGMASCGGGVEPTEQPPSEECKHHYVVDDTKTVAATCTVDGKKVAVCDKCGAEKETKISKTGHKFVDKADQTGAKAPTCTEAGEKIQVCSNANCTETRKVEVAALGHEFVEKADQTGAKAPTCTEAGEVLQECSRCHEAHTEAVEALGHTYEAAADQSTAKAPTCTEAGTSIEECSVCHDTREVDVPATGHTFGEPEVLAATDKGIAMNKVVCEKGDTTRIYWNAGDTTEATKTELVNKLDPKVADSAVIKPRIVGSDEEGWQFWGRPVGNGGALDENGNASENAQAEDALQSVEGDYFEFKLDLKEKIEGWKLVTYMTPSQWCPDVFKIGSEADWTKGFKFDAEGNASFITDFRYVISVDGKAVDLNDGTYVNQRSSGRNWYTFPGTYNLDAGEHTLRITMAGGYKHTFFNFGFEKPVAAPVEDTPAHEHEFVYGDPVAKEGESTYAVGVCECGKKAYKISAAQDLNKKITAEGKKLPKGTNGYDGTAIALYKFSVDAPVKGHLMAKVNVDNASNWTEANGYSYYTGKNGGSSAIQVLPDNKTNTVMTVNGDTITMPTTTYYEMGIRGTTPDTCGIADYGEFTLKAGTNEFTLAATDSYGLQYFEFYFVEA